MTVTGTGGGGAKAYGVYVAGGDTAITAVNGDITITGNGGGSLASQQDTGVVITSQGEVAATGAGDLTIVGTGGLGDQLNLGVSIGSAPRRRPPVAT